VNKVLKGIFVPKAGRVTEQRKNCIMRSFVVCNLHIILLERIKQEG
jgi:hypothetical protein